MKLKISKRASSDLEEIYIYGCINFGEDKANEYANLIKDRLYMICDNPEIGRLDTKVNPAIRRFEIEHHIVFYDIENENIFVVRLLHKSTDYIHHLI